MQNLEVNLDICFIVSNIIYLFQKSTSRKRSHFELQMEENFKIGMVIALREEGLCFRVIGERVGMTKSKVHRLYMKYLLEGKTTTRRIGSGRPRLTTRREDAMIVREVKKDRFITSNEVKENLPQLRVGTRTIQRRITESNIFKSYFATKKPFISATNRNKRFEWAKAHLNWTIDQWKTVIFSDESPYTLAFHGKRRVWRMHNERYNPLCTIGTIKHDKKINVWGCFCYHGVGNIHNIEGNMNAPMYIQILDNELRPSAARLYGNDDFIFQQDNDPKHTAKATKEYIDMYEFNVLDWPSQSPDLNPIENLWSILDQKLKFRKVNTLNALFDALEEGWNNLSIDILHRFIESMPRRCQAVIDSKGFMTKY